MLSFVHKISFANPKLIKANMPRRTKSQRLTCSNSRSVLRAEMTLISAVADTNELLKTKRTPGRHT
jgi:hypothetical protein